MKFQIPIAFTNYEVRGHQPGNARQASTTTAQPMSWGKKVADLLPFKITIRHSSTRGTRRAPDNSVRADTHARLNWELRENRLASSSSAKTQTPTPTAKWQTLNNNCAEQAVDTLAQKLNLERPQFAYQHDRVWDQQIDFSQCVALINEWDRNISSKKIDPVCGSDRVENGKTRANSLVSYLRSASISDVFVMRTGPQSGAGHFAVVSFDDKNKCWHCFSSQKNKFNITMPHSREASSACCERLKGVGDYPVYLDKLHAEDIKRYEQFIVECRNQQINFVIP